MTLWPPATLLASVPPSANTLFGEGGPFPITSTMLTTWIIALFIILALRILVGRPQLIPGRGQAVLEGVITAIRDLIEPIVGKAVTPKVFPLLITLFLFIVLNNWSGLLPGVGSLYWNTGHGDEAHWDKLIRPANTDLNTTLALSLLAMAAWLYFCLRYAGLKVLLFDLFGNKADPTETPKVIYILLFPIFVGVGAIELVSIAFRPVSLSLRLYGNIYGGENFLLSIFDLAPWFVPIPVYFFELMVGVIQAFIFTLLVAIYIGLICNHEGGEHAHDHAEPGPAGHPAHPPAHA